MKGNISIYMCYKENSVFLKEENRDGYIVSALMKKVWAVELDLLRQCIPSITRISSSPSCI